MIIVNAFQLLTIITKHSILDVAAALDPPLKLQQYILKRYFVNQVKNLIHYYDFSLALI